LGMEIRNIVFSVAHSVRKLCAVLLLMMYYLAGREIIVELVEFS